MYVNGFDRRILTVLDGMEYRRSMAMMGSDYRESNGRFGKGNPYGRESSNKSIIATIRGRTQDGVELVNELFRIAYNERHPLRERIRCLQELLDRGFGRAPLIIQSDSSETHTFRLELSSLSPDALTKYIGHLGALQELMSDQVEVIEGESSTT